MRRLLRPGRRRSAAIVAIGQNAATTAANQVVLGGTGTSVKIGDIAASDAAQVGVEQAVTIDNFGTLGLSNVASAAALDEVRVSMATIAAVTDAQFATLEGRVDTLFDLQTADRKDTRQGIAAVAAMANPHFPSEDGKTSYATNVAYYRGEVGVSGGLMHRVSSGFAVTAGVSYAGGHNTAVRGGIAGEF